MLRPLEEKEFERYAEASYALALDPTRSGYPTYTDGIKTREDFMERSKKAFSRENEGILLYERDGAVRGWIHYYRLPEDRYIGTCSFCIGEGMYDAVCEFVEHARRHWSGNELFLGFPRENTEAAAALAALGFEIIEQDYNDAIDMASYVPRPTSPDVIAINGENYSLFAPLHSQHEDMYWNSERIAQTLDQWKIYAAVKDGVVLGAIYFQIWEDRSMDEIFGVDFKDGIYDGEVFRSLLTVVLNEEKRRGAGHLVFFNDEESQADALACGFRCVGEYVCFKSAV